MNRYLRKWIILLLAAAVALACRREDIISPNLPHEVDYTGMIPQNLEELPSVVIHTPGPVESRDEWQELSTISITAKVDGKQVLLYNEDSLKVKGRGNSSWLHYPKKSYALKLKHKADFVGTGKTTRWVLLANWMDRTLLRNEVAFELARRTCLAWTPSGTFVNVTLNDVFLGVYWLGERIHVEGSHFKADYLYSYDTSNPDEVDFYTSRGRSVSSHQDGHIPVGLKYPDRDNYPTEAAFNRTLIAARDMLYDIEASIYNADAALSRINVDSFCDWYLLHEVCGNVESRHPKSCFFYVKNGVLYAGPVWDFDWNTFVPDQQRLLIMNTLYFHQLIPIPGFKERLKYRWQVLKPRFEEGIDEFIDSRAAYIKEAEKVNHQLWPCDENPLAQAEGFNDGMVNKDEKMTFEQAVERLKLSLHQRIYYVDYAIRQL